MRISAQSRGLKINTSTGGGACSLPPVAFCLNAHGVRIDAESETLVPLTGGGFDVGAMAFDLAQITSKTNRTRVGACLPASTLNAAGQMHVAQPWAVRRLTPRECERLQGFPDDFTRIPYRRRPADLCPDGPRYKALGNSMAVNCMAWLGERIEIVNQWGYADRKEGVR